MSGAPNQPRTIEIFGAVMPVPTLSDGANMARSYIRLLLELDSKQSGLPVEEVKWGGLAKIADTIAAICRAQDEWVAAHAEACADVEAGGAAQSSPFRGELP